MNEVFFLIDLPAGMAALLASLGCTLAGNWLVLRRESLLGDALSHMVLPGIVVGFLIAGTLAPLAMLAGALAAGLAGVALAVLLRRFVGVEANAALGIVFTTFFAAGVVALESTGARNVHLDVEHALFGNLEGIIWPGPAGFADFGAAAVWLSIPSELVTLAGVLVLLALLSALLHKELRLASFDPDFARVVGLSPGVVTLGLATAATLAAVAAFQAVGAILVVAMLICPAAAARLLTNRLDRQIWLSLAIAAATALAGYALAASAPLWLGTVAALHAGGTIATLSGLTVALAALRRGGERSPGQAPSI